jgi:dihydrofolate reductase
MSFDVVVAIDDALGIGKQGQVPWHLPGDLAHLVALTRHSGGDRPNAVIMGRKTWESIPLRYRPLAGRHNVVITRQPGYAVPSGVAVATDLDAALRAAGAAAADRRFVLGGGEIYRDALAHPDCGDLYLTQVSGEFGCDTFFPPFRDRFVCRERLREAVENGIPYRIEVWRRRTG